jgi:NADH-quinone oxidoreductase subunit A
MADLVLLILVFLATGSTVLVANLVLGRLVRPNKPNAEKSEAYECGETPIGSPWVQFDLRFYVVALLFVIFDVELSFFFPWAVVFGSATRAADESRPIEQRIESARSIQPVPSSDLKVNTTFDSSGMHKLAWAAFADIALFLGILLTGFGYLWRRGDLQWIRSVAGQANGGAAEEG